MERVYRFRSIERLLGPSQELERQEIYFAHPSELNDPAEGLLPFFWRGDKIVWTNFFRHYLYCLHWKCMDFLVMSGHLKIQEIPLPVMGDRDFADIPMLVEIHKRAVDRILDDNKVQECIEFLSRSQYSMNKIHILLLLETFQSSALEAIRSAHQESENKLPFLPNKPMPTMPLDLALGILKEIKHMNKDVVHINEVLMQSQWNQISLKRSSFILDSNDERSDVFNDNRNYLFYDFPRIYLEHLPILIYPDWNAACFSRNWDNSIAWTIYGDNHQGVCLIFRKKHDFKEATFALNTKNQSDKNNDQEAAYPYKFSDVNYESNIEQIDYFRALCWGELSSEILDKIWYTNDEGERSECATSLQYDVESEIEEHYNQFFSTIVQKSIDWQHEEETRLVRFGDLSEEERLAIYEFSSLVGVIFGIRTRDSKKIQIIDIIQRKCTDHGRDTFEFYQAYFTDEGKIRKCKIDVSMHDEASP